MMGFNLKHCKELGFSVGLLVKLPNEDYPEGKEVSYEGYQRVVLDSTTKKVCFRFNGPPQKIVGIGFYGKDDHLWVYADANPNVLASYNIEIIANLDDLNYF